MGPYGQALVIFADLPRHWRVDFCVDLGNLPATLDCA